MGLIGQESLFEWYARMRSSSPVGFSEEWRCWNVFTYEHVLQVLRNPSVFSSSPPFQGEGEYLSQSLILMDPPTHTAFRSLVNNFFTAKSVQALEPRISQIARELLGRLRGRGVFDFVKEFAVPLPVTVIAEMLGVPPEDLELFKRWTDSIVGADGGGGFGSSQQSLADYMAKIVEGRRREPRQDLISHLLKAEVEGRKLSEQELLGFCSLLLVAGNETTTNLLGNAVRALSENPEAHARLLADPEGLLTPMIEETLRYYSPVQVLPHRFAKADYVLAGQAIKAGDQVAVWLGSANRDEKKFPEASRFIVDRRPNEHIAFGSGPHMCLGAPLARLEARVGLKAFLEASRSFSIRESHPLSGPIVFGYRSLVLEVEG